MSKIIGHKYYNSALQTVHGCARQIPYGETILPSPAHWARGWGENKNARSLLLNGMSYL